MDKEKIKELTIKYHSEPKPGKTEIRITKKLKTIKDITLAYTPGVSEIVKKILENEENVNKYTIKNNLVAVITNGSAVLGLGNVGALASKPVMESKSMLFKHFANIDSFDIEIDSKNKKDFIKTVINISSTFGGINLEDIKSPECFVIEKELKKKLKIPVFHDDQHGTAIVICAALINAIEIQKKKKENIKINILGAGAAGIATANFFTKIGIKKEQIVLIDSKGVINKNRNDINIYKKKFANQTKDETLIQSINGADVIIGVSKEGLISKEAIIKMNKNPIIFTLANPTPEILPEIIKNIRKDALIATGRSDYKNQINNAICFPYIFKGALTAKAKQINIKMKIAAMNAIKDIARNDDKFGINYIIPKITDKRLLSIVSSEVEKSARY